MKKDNNVNSGHAYDRNGILYRFDRGPCLERGFLIEGRTSEVEAGFIDQTAVLVVWGAADRPSDAAVQPRPEAARSVPVVPG